MVCQLLPAIFRMIDVWNTLEGCLCPVVCWLNMPKNSLAGAFNPATTKHFACATAHNAIDKQRSGTLNNG